MDNELVRSTKRLLDCMYYIGIIITAFIPVIFKQIGFYISSFHRFYLQQSVLYMLSGVLCLNIVYELRKMFKTILNENPFVDENTVSLKKMAKCSFLIALVSLIRIPLTPTPATVVVIIVFAIAGLFSIVLCQVFEKAIQFKLENELTI